MRQGLNHMTMAVAIGTWPAAVLLIVSACSTSGGHTSAHSQRSAATSSAAAASAMPGTRLSQPSTETIIQRIKQQYADVRNRRHSFRTVEREPGNFSTEGGVLLGFFDGDRLRLVEATFYGETGRAYREFYYDDRGRLFFLFESERLYEKPFSDRSGPHEYRYYFDGERLIRLLDGTRQVSPDDAQYVFRVRELLKLSRLLTDAVR